MFYIYFYQSNAKYPTIGNNILDTCWIVWNLVDLRSTGLEKNNQEAQDHIDKNL